jgi:hypothetical protein
MDKWRMENEKMGSMERRVVVILKILEVMM